MNVLSSHHELTAPAMLSPGSSRAPRHTANLVLNHVAEPFNFWAKLSSPGVMDIEFDGFSNDLAPFGTGNGSFDIGFESFDTGPGSFDDSLSAFDPFSVDWEDNHSFGLGSNTSPEYAIRNEGNTDSFKEPLRVFDPETPEMKIVFDGQFFDDMWAIPPIHAATPDAVDVEAVVGLKRKAEDEADPNHPAKRRAASTANNARDKEANAHGRYIDTKIHVVEKCRIRNIGPLKEDVPHSNITIKYQIRDDDESIDEEKHECFIDQINMQGIGAEVFRCPVPDCHVALVRRFTVDRHFQKFHGNDPKHQYLKYNSHPTMVSYTYGEKRAYRRRSKDVIAAEKAANGGKLKPQKRPKK